MTQVRTRCRSFCFLHRESERWTAFLLTYPRADGQWCGYFTFRSGQSEVREVRTADVFVEPSEACVDERARGLGRPLLLALLDSALSAHERRADAMSPRLHQWFRQELARSGAARESVWRHGDAPTLAQLRSLYDSYRLDQVTHLVALIDPDDFRELVDVLLANRRIDFRATDRFQMAMSVVQDLERRLPLPPFDVWMADYLAHPDEYRRYAFALHAGGELP